MYLTGEHAERMKLLVDALRSGNFTQARERLTRIEYGKVVGHCCLGVATIVAQDRGCRVAVRTDAHADLDLSTVSRAGLRYGDLDSVAEVSEQHMLPVVAAWYGTSKFDWSNVLVPRRVAARYPNGANGYQAFVVDPAKRYSAVALNDKLLFTFADIADCFEHTFLRNLDVVDGIDGTVVNPVGTIDAETSEGERE